MFIIYELEGYVEGNFSDCFVFLFLGCGRGRRERLEDVDLLFYVFWGER